MIIEGQLMYFRWGKDAYEPEKHVVNVTNLDDVTVAELQKQNVNVQNLPTNEKKKNWGNFVKCKSHYAPKVIDSQKKVISEATLIGNGTRAKVAVEPFTYSNKFGEGTGLGHQTIQILDLVPYEASSNIEDFEVEEGWNVVDEPVQAPSTTKKESAEIKGAEAPSDFDDEIPF